LLRRLLFSICCKFIGIGPFIDLGITLEDHLVNDRLDEIGGIKFLYLVVAHHDATQLLIELRLHLDRFLDFVESLG
jgi:hypothetical protein